ncbi:MAG: hypothetical protein EBQ94_11045 [Flavobacteriales bacterium]|jgi:hypothetical protein|nr:hypothetical protein [Flavobacteriales bacterium]NCA20586.1 hypothetical protein [Crocinitomicaceae bacterium]
MIKILVDRVQPDSAKIEKNQNFDLILKKINQGNDKKSIPWFYGAIGFACAFIAILTVFL